MEDNLDWSIDCIYNLLLINGEQADLDLGVNKIRQAIFRF